YFNVYKNSYERLNEIAQDLNYPFLNPSSNPMLEIPEETDLFITDVLTNGINTEPNIYEEVLSIQERKFRLSENNLIFATNAVITRDTRENINDNNFSLIRLKIESAGNLLSGVSSLAGLEKNSSGN